MIVVPLSWLLPDTARMVALAHPTTISAATDAPVETASITNRSLSTFNTYDMDGGICIAAALNALVLNDRPVNNHQVATFHGSRGGGRKNICK